MTSIDTLDITNLICPMTMVKVKLALEDMDDKQRLILILKAGETYHNVTQNLRADGHIILNERIINNETIELLIENRINA